MARAAPMERTEPSMSDANKPNPAGSGDVPLKQKADESAAQKSAGAAQPAPAGAAPGTAPAPGATAPAPPAGAAAAPAAPAPPKPKVPFSPVLTRYINDPQAYTLAHYQGRGGYETAKAHIGITPP